MTRRALLSSLAIPALAQRRKLPNIVLINADDLGSGDLSCYGHPTIRTPNLDRLASDGVRFTQFYSAAPLCSPSRAALLTGRYQVRSGVNFVLFPDSTGGLPDSELTIAALLKQRGYATHVTGKWHLGHLPQYLPAKRGFDGYFGIPFSNDMSLKTNVVYDEINKKKGLTRPPSALDRYRTLPGVPLMRNEEVLERDPDQTQLTARYTEDAIAFIKGAASRGAPFFLYLAHTMPHVPLFASARFRGKSRGGLFGDVVEELDWSVGEIRKTLAALKLDENTLILFTSDNGAPVQLADHGGSNGPLREGKATTWDGGYRAPFIACWKGRIQPGRVIPDVASALDVFPTIARMTGGLPPASLVLDGADLAPVLWEGSSRTQRDFFYYHAGMLHGMRRGPWKLRRHSAKEPDALELYHLESDYGERVNVAAQNPEIVAQMKDAMASHQASFQPAVTQR
ncbi:MAG: sulfatase [Acidobacteria bacterium]|nr:sulfatase [Acidobacteriota bacterium]